MGLRRLAWSNYAIFDVGRVQFGLEPSEKLEIFFLVEDVDKTCQSLKEKEVKLTTESDSDMNNFGL